jgi:hypothetical protein
MEEHFRNQEISHLLNIWDWCSRPLHVKWKRKRKLRNDCLMGIAYAVSEGMFAPDINGFTLPQVYKTLPVPLLNEATVLEFWDAHPTALLEMSLGTFTKGPSLAAQLERLRLTRQNNPALDKIVKTMHSREERFGFDWLFEGHHPESEFARLQEEMAPLCAEIKDLIVRNHATVEAIAQEVLAQGPWQRGKLPASLFVRKTPESLLNRATRLKLWQAAQEVLSQDLEEEERLEALCNVFYRKITPAVKAAIEAQGYSVDFVVDDVLNFDMYKSRAEITGSATG